MTSSLTSAARAERRKRTLGHNAQCETCQWSDPAALTKANSGIRCYECQCLIQGKASTEKHHHLGRAVDSATVAIPGNIHRDLSDRQRDWDLAIRTNSQRDPLLWLAAAMLGLHDHLAWWTEWIGRIAAWLTQLSASLAERDGERWWDAMQLQPLWAEVAP